MTVTRSLRWAVLAAASVLAPAAARGGANEELLIARAAGRVESALGKDDREELARLAAVEEPDPWLVADALLARGNAKAAAAFAAAGVGPDVEHLPRYVADAPLRPAEEARRRAFAAAWEAEGASDWGLALERAQAGVLGPDSVLLVRLHLDRLRALRRLKRVREAVEACAHAGEVATRLGWRRQAARALDEARALCWGIPDHPRALGFADRVLALQRERRDEAGVTEALVHVGSVQDALGRYREALETMEQARARHEAAGNRPGVVAALGNLGVIRRHLGDLDEALRLQERVLVLAEEQGHPAQIARTQQRLGVLLRERGELDRALALQQRAAGELLRLGHGGEAALALVAAANIHRLQGDGVRGLEVLERALAAAREAGDGKAEAFALLNLGAVRRGLGDVEEGIRLQEQALAIWQTAGDRRASVTALLGLSRAHVQRRQADRALPFVERALLLARELGSEGLIARAEAAHAEVLIAVWRPEEALRVAEGAVRRAEARGDLREVAAAWQTLGDVRHGRVEPALALPALRKAADAARRLRSRSGVVTALAGEARALRATGDPAGTMVVAREIASLLEDGGRGHDEESAASTRALGLNGLEEGALAAQTLGDGDAAVFFLEAGRAGALREALGSGEALRAEDLPDALRTSEEQARLAEAKAFARFTWSLERSLPDLDVRGTELDAARGERREAARRIQRWAKARGGGAAPGVASREEIQQALAPGDVLVLYGWFGSHVLAAVVRPESVRLVTVGSRTPTEQAIDAAWPPRHDEVRPETVAAARQAVLGALELTDADRRLLVSPDGPLHRVPWALLEERREVVLVPSGSVLALLRARAPARGSGVLALGDPARGDSGLGMGLPRLPASADEARAVGDVVLLGAEATEPGLRRVLASRPRWRAVHLACHGIVDGERPLLSCLALAPSAEDDGLLTGHEILRLRVPADLVVLSGCDTAQGKAFRGEGVLGLSRAFLLAGSSRVLASLWKVDDEATRAFMETLHAAWKGGEPLGGSLGRARARLQADPRWSHPRHWAAFVLWGVPEA